MGDGDLESRLVKLAKAPLNIAKFCAVPAGVGLGIGSLFWSYAALKKGSIPSFEEFADCIGQAVSNPATWGMAAAGTAVSYAAIWGMIALENRKRKQKGKSPINIGQALKQAFLPWTMPKGEEGAEKALESLPDSSLALRQQGDWQFRNGKIIDAMESYYRAMQMMDSEIFTKIPIAGTNSYVSAVKDHIPELEKRLRDEPPNNQIKLELAMRHFILRDFDRAVDYFEMININQNPLAFHTLASRFYSEIAKRAEQPKIRRLSAGNTGGGRAVDRALRGKGHRKSREKMEIRARSATFEAVRHILQDSSHQLERIGDYDVYRVKLNRFANWFFNGFVVIKSADIEQLERERKNEQIFRETVSGGRFKSVHPDGIVSYDGKKYLVLLHEDGTPLMDSSNPEHFREAMRFAARSDALMPLDYVKEREHLPRGHFEWRLETSAIADEAREMISNNCDFLFRYSHEFPVVFDGDWHGGNCLVDSEGCIIALDKDGKRVNTGPNTTARILNQGTTFGTGDMWKDAELKDRMISADYCISYNELADKDRKIESPELLIPATLAATMEKAVTTYCFAKPFPNRHRQAGIFLENAIAAGARIRIDKKISDYYDKRHRSQCLWLERAIERYLLPDLRAA